MRKRAISWLTLVIAVLSVAALLATSSSNVADPAAIAAIRIANSNRAIQQANHGKVLVVGLGDSVTSGYHCACATFVSLYAKRVQAGTSLPTVAANDGKPGQDSTGLLTALDTPTPTAAAVRKASFVLISIGANDLSEADPTCDAVEELPCLRAALPTMQANLEAILARIHTLTAGHPAAIRVLDYWNVFEDGDAAIADYTPEHRADSIAITKDANAAICRAAISQGAPCVDTFAAFDGPDGTSDPTGLLEADGDHPNARGHALIARLLAAVGYAPVA